MGEYNIDFELNQRVYIIVKSKNYGKRIVLCKISKIKLEYGVVKYHAYSEIGFSVDFSEKEIGVSVFSDHATAYLKSSFK